MVASAAGRRGRHVERYLVAQGIPAALLQIYAEGPVAFRTKNATRYGTHSDRRVEFAIVRR